MNAYQLGRSIAMITRQHRHINKRAGLGRAFLYGIDPLGTGTVNLGRTTPESEYAPMQLAGIAGGLVGGGLLVPAALTGTAAVVPEFQSLLTQPAVGSSFGRRFLQGAVAPYRNMWEGALGYRTLSQLGRTGAPLSPSAGQQLAKTIMRGMTLEQAQQFVKQHAPNLLQTLPANATRSAESLASHVQQLFSNPATSAKTLKSVATTLRPQLGRSLAAGGMLIGIPALLAGYAAYKQYKLGQQLRSEAARRAAAPQAQQAAGGFPWL